MDEAMTRRLANALDAQISCIIQDDVRLRDAAEEIQERIDTIATEWRTIRRIGAA